MWEVLTIIVSNLCSIGLTAFFTMKATRKKANAEADLAAINSLKEAFEVHKKITDEAICDLQLQLVKKQEKEEKLKADYEKLKADYVAARREIEQLRQEINKLRKENKKKYNVKKNRSC